MVHRPWSIVGSLCRTRERRCTLALCSALVCQRAPWRLSISIIAVDHLTRFYGKSRGIADVSFGVDEGEIFGFIGPNGAGKSTTIRLLLSLIYPTSGSTTIFGRDCIAHGAELRQDIGYLPSEVFYYEGTRVIDLLAGAHTGHQRRHVLIQVGRLPSEWLQVADYRLETKDGGDQAGMHGYVPESALCLGGWLPERAISPR